MAGGTSKDRDRFIRKVTATRNYRTHFDQRLEGEAAHWEELYRISQKLRALVEVCLMGEIGFDPGAINAAISRTR